MAQKIQMSVIDFVTFMCTKTNRHMAALTAETCIDNKQMQGGKKTAEKYGGYVTKLSRITFNHSIDYQKAVENGYVKLSQKLMSLSGESDYV